VAALLEALQLDPHEVVLTRNEYQEHEVGSALKRFFVNLPAPVLSEDLMNQLAAAEDDWPQLGQLLRRELDTVSVATVTKVFGHLHLISREHARNKMDATNLATVWAVGLTHEDRVCANLLFK
jgi:RhoGAP domain